MYVTLCCSFFIFFTSKTNGKKTKQVYACAISPNGNSIISGSADNTIRVWNMDTKQCVAVLQGHTDYVCNFLFLFVFFDDLISILFFFQFSIYLCFFPFFSFFILFPPFVSYNRVTFFKPNNNIISFNKKDIRSAINELSNYLSSIQFLTISTNFL
jgi:WD40 repeat protein